MTSSDPSLSTAPPVKQPLVNIPPVTLLLLLVITAVQLVRMFVLSETDDHALVVLLGFIPARLYEDGLHDGHPWITLISYSLLHFGWMHFFVNVTALAAFGAAVERTFGIKTYLIVLILGIVVGALVHFAFYKDSVVLLGGISAGISTLFAIVLGLMQQGRSALTGQNPWFSVFKPALAWVVINIIVGLMGVPGEAGLAVGWIAHLGGFAVGLLCLPCVVPAYRIVKRDIKHD